MLKAGENYHYRRLMGTMVWNVLWMAAMAAAAMLAGFCMGRLTMRSEVEAAGEGAARTYSIGWKRGERLQKFQSANDGKSEYFQATSTVGAAGSVPRQGQSLGYDEEVEGHRAINADFGDGAEEEDIGNLRTQRPNRRSAGGQMWLLKAASAAREVVAVSRRTPVGGYGYGTGQSRIDRTGRTSRGQRRSLSTMSMMRKGRDSQEAEGESYSLGSPVSGYVLSFREGDRPAAVIQPMEDKLYAPASGKIIRLFPMGNDFLFVTEFGAELRIRAGDTDDDLLGRYFRPRVVQNEIVAKGKLLLEFDRQSLAAEGASTMVTLSVEHRAYGSNVRLTADEEVKTGQELLRIVERAESENIRRR